VRRRLFLATGVAALAGCGINNKVNQSGFHQVLEKTQWLNEAVIGTRGSARLYADADVDREFRTNGFDTPADSHYQTMARDGFRSYKLAVDGEVEHAQAFSLQELRALGALTQITRREDA